MVVANVTGPPLQDVTECYLSQPDADEAIPETPRQYLNQAFNSRHVPADEVRLEANGQRHADANATLPNSSDAARAVEFAEALGQFLFVLPARVNRGLQSASS